MKIINVQIKKIKVKSFNPKDSNIELSIIFDDGSEKEISKYFVSGNSEKTADIIFIGIRNMEHKLNYEFDGEKIKDTVTKIVIENEENVKSRMIKFLCSITEKINKIKTAQIADGYLNMVNSVKFMEKRF